MRKMTKVAFILSYSSSHVQNNVRRHGRACIDARRPPQLLLPSTNRRAFVCGSDHQRVWRRPLHGLCEARVTTTKCAAAASSSSSSSIREGLIVEIQSQGSSSSTSSSSGRRLAQVMRADGKRNWFVQDGNGQQLSITPKQITFVLGHPDTDDQLSGVSLSTLFADAHTKACSSADLLELAWQLESETGEDDDEERKNSGDDKIDYMSQMIMDDVDPLCKLATHVLLCGEENIYFKPRLINGVYHYEARSPSNVAELRTLRLSGRMEEEARQRRKTLFAEVILQRRDAAMFQEAIESVNESNNSGGSNDNNKIEYATFISHLIDIAVEYDPSSSSSSSSASTLASAEEHRYQTLSGNTAFSQLRPAYKAVMREVFDSCALTLCPRSALHIAVQLRVLNKHENLSLRRCNFEAKWTHDNSIIQPYVDAMLHNSSSSSSSSTANNNGTTTTASSIHLPDDRDKDLRVDLTGMLAIAIDSADTSEVDDAFSYDMDTDTIYVHIADPSRYFPDDDAVVTAAAATESENRNKGSSSRTTALSKDPIVQLAMERTATLYLPYTKFTMFPPDIATRVLSLNGDWSDGSALTFKFQLDSDGALKADTMEVMMSRISRPIRLTYEEADIIFTAPSTIVTSSSSSAEMQDMMRRIHELMGRRRYWREMEGGAIIINSPIARVSVTNETDDHPQVSCDAIATDTPAWLAVSELMITACCIGAQVCVDNNLPVPFRSQEAFDYASDEELESYEDGPVRATLVFKQASATLVGIHAGEHASLGLDYYVQVTSPIRRSLDYVTQVQIKRWLSNRKNSDNDGDGSSLIEQGIVVDEITRAQSVGKQLRGLEMTTNRYWQMLFLCELRPMPYVLEATFLKPLKESNGGGGMGVMNALLYVDELGFSVVVQTRTELKLGDKVDMEVRGVDARANHIDAMLRKKKKVTMGADGATTTSMSSVSDSSSSNGDGKENGVERKDEEELEQLFRDSLSQISAEGD